MNIEKAHNNLFCLTSELLPAEHVNTLTHFRILFLCYREYACSNKMAETWADGFFLILQPATDWLEFSGISKRANL